LEFDVHSAPQRMPHHIHQEPKIDGNRCFFQPQNTKTRPLFYTTCLLRNRRKTFSLGGLCDPITSNSLPSQPLHISSS
jgi:hypothetical protein